MVKLGSFYPLIKFPKVWCLIYSTQLKSDKVHPPQQIPTGIFTQPAYLKLVRTSGFHSPFGHWHVWFCFLYKLTETQFQWPFKWLVRCEPGASWASENPQRAADYHFKWLRLQEDLNLPLPHYLKGYVVVAGLVMKVASLEKTYWGSRSIFRIRKIGKNPRNHSWKYVWGQ